MDSTDNNYFDFNVSDGNGYVLSSRLYFRVFSLNDLPTVVNNAGLNVSSKSQNNIISDAMLKYTKSPVMNNLMILLLSY